MQERAGQIEPQARRLGLMLERAEQEFRVANTATRVGEPDSDSVLTLTTDANREVPDRPVSHSSLAVTREVQEYLEQALPVRPNGRQVLRDI